MLVRRFLPVALIILLLVACQTKSAKTEYSDADISSEETIEPNEDEIDSLAFEKLITLTDSTAKGEKLSDSLAFLIIPLEAVCPHCRDKAIKALFTYRSQIPKDRFVIISSNSYKGIRAFFAEKNQEAPEAKGKIFLDGESKAFKSNLVFMHPTIYYARGKEIIEKIISYPSNIDKVLDDFFKVKS